MGAGEIRAVSLKSGQAVSPNALETGDQAVIENGNGLVSFAGYDVDLDNVSGAMGYSSAAAYVIVASGAASAAGETARAGEILILMPRGEGAAAQFYDAGRYAGSWDEASISAHPAVYEQLDAVAGRQKWKIFFGRLGTTSFNIAAPGSAHAETARRSIVGDATVRDIRFSGVSDGVEIERSVVRTFTDALSSGDVRTVAELLDPTPYGGANMSGQAAAARQMVAERMVDQEQWSSLVAGREFTRTADAGVWQAATPAGEIVIRLTYANDFIFVSNIKRGI
uniref:Uncharacterized protein n=1 Tax=Aquisalinus luteolus TaxID=1566827 RepID=A0A8J3A6X3_9PROT|nr:hypothetical protein GCM10011355_18350 [Aquisalinus luteolus]